MMIMERWKSCSNARPKYLSSQSSIVGGGTKKLLSEAEESLPIHVQVLYLMRHSLTHTLTYTLPHHTQLIPSIGSSNLIF